MRTLHVGLRVSDLDRSLAFYGQLGYLVVGAVEGTQLGDLTMLRLPGDPFVAIELVHDPSKGPIELGDGLSHLVVQVESLAATLAQLAKGGVLPEAPGIQGRPDEPRTSWLTDPDGYRIELVQWPDGHAEGMSEADWQESS